MRQTEPDPKQLEGSDLANAIELTINQVILKLAKRTFKLLEKDDISGLAGLIRASHISQNSRSIWRLIENNNLDCREVQKLIMDEYGIRQEDY